jgi:hypothetical protein
MGWLLQAQNCIRLALVYVPKIIVIKLMFGSHPN